MSAEQRAADQPPSRRLPNLPKLKGWWTPGTTKLVKRKDRPDGPGQLFGTIFEASDGKVYAAIRCLRSEDEDSPYRDIDPTNWYLWIKTACRWLDPGINGGKIHAALAPDPDPARTGRWVIVWLKEDADLIARCWNSSKLRRAPEGRTGKWEPGGGIWADDEYGNCARDKSLAESLERHELYFGYYRKHPHPRANASKSTTP